MMTIAERAAAIADLALPGEVRGKLRRDRIYARAVQMLTEVKQEAEIVKQTHQRQEMSR